MPHGIHNGHTGPKRHPKVREMDKIELVRLLRRGWSMSRIARHFDLAPGSITHDYKQILQEAAQDYRGNVKHLQARKLAELEEIKEEARSAWDAANGRYLEEVICQVLKQVEDSQEAGTGTPTKFNIEVKKAPPNDYLVTILKAIGLEIDLQDLMPAKKKQVDKHGITMTVNWDQLATAMPSTVKDEVEERIQNMLPNHEQRNGAQ